MRILALFSLCLSITLTAAKADEEFVTLQSYNMPDRYVCARNGIAELLLFEANSEAADSNAADFCFRMVKGLDGTDSVSFESKNQPGQYLRHKNFRLVVDTENGSELFQQDASFRKVPGLADESGVSFESVNNPGRYIRHRNFKLYLESGEGILFQKDCTFSVVKALQ